MGNGRIEDTSDGFLLVNDLGIEFTCYTGLKTCGILAVVEEGLRCYLMYVLSWRIAVYSMEELVVLTSYDSSIARAELIVEVAFFIIVYCIVGNEKSCGDKAFFILKNRLTASERSVGVSCYADTACINIRKRCNVLYTVVKTVCVIFVIPPGTGFDNLRVTVAVHTDGEDNVSAAGILNVVEVLHLAVVVPTVANYDSGCLAIFGSGLGY